MPGLVTSRSFQRPLFIINHSYRLRLHISFNSLVYSGPGPTPAAGLLDAWQKRPENTMARKLILALTLLAVTNSRALCEGNERGVGARPVLEPTLEGSSTLKAPGKQQQKQHRPTRKEQQDDESVMVGRIVRALGGKGQKKAAGGAAAQKAELDRIIAAARELVDKSGPDMAAWGGRDVRLKLAAAVTGSGPSTSCAAAFKAEVGSPKRALIGPALVS